MADEKELLPEEVDDDEIIIVMTDEDGNESYYCEEMILSVDGEKYALLTPAGDGSEDEHEHEEGCGCGCGHEEEDEAFFAKIVLDENGEEEYIEPTDEEFEAVCKAYEKLVDEEETEEE